MNTPYQNATLADAYVGTDADGRTVLIGRFEGHASDGYRTDYLHQPVTWAVWVRGGQVLSAHRYSGSHRATALREWREIAKMPNVAHPADGQRREWADMTWKRWAPLARRLTKGADCHAQHAAEGD